MLLGKGEINSQSALELSTLTKNWLDAIYAHQEYDLKLQAQGGGAEQVIRIEGGLPSLPGCDVIMPPRTNANAHELQELAAPNAQSSALDQPRQTLTHTPMRNDQEPG